MQAGDENLAPEPSFASLSAMDRRARLQAWRAQRESGHKAKEAPQPRRSSLNSNAGSAPEGNRRDSLKRKESPASSSGRVGLGVSIVATFSTNSKASDSNNKKRRTSSIETAAEREAGGSKVAVARASAHIVVSSTNRMRGAMSTLPSPSASTCGSQRLAPPSKQAPVRAMKAVGEGERGGRSKLVPVSEADPNAEAMAKAEQALGEGELDVVRQELDGLRQSFEGCM